MTFSRKKKIKQKIEECRKLTTDGGKWGDCQLHLFKQ